MLWSAAFRIGCFCCCYFNGCEYKLQINAITAAKEAACLILSVDETVKNPKVTAVIPLVTISLNYFAFACTIFLVFHLCSFYSLFVLCLFLIKYKIISAFTYCFLMHWNFCAGCVVTLAFNNFKHHHWLLIDGNNFSRRVHKVRRQQVQWLAGGEVGQLSEDVVEEEYEGEDGDHADNWFFMLLFQGVKVFLTPERDGLVPSSFWL